MICIEETQN